MYFLDECRSQLTGFDYELMSSTLSVAIYSLMTWNMQVKTVGTHSNYIRFYRTGIIGDMPTSWVMHALSLLAGEYDFFGVPNIYNGSLKELYFYPMDTEFMFNNAVFNDFISSGQFEIPNAQTINTPNGPLFVPAGYYNFEYFDYTYNNVTEQGIVVIFP